MEFSILAVFCAYFAVAYSQEFNSTISSQLTGRMVPTRIGPQFEAPRMNLVRIRNDEGKVVCEATLVTKNSIAMTDWCSERGDVRQALVLCKGGNEEGKYLKYPMDANLQQIRGIGIVEVEFTAPVSEECWPEGREVFPKISPNANKGDLVRLSRATTDGHSLPFNAQIEYIDDNYIIIGDFHGHNLQCAMVDGYTLYHNYNLIGMFSFKVVCMFNNLRRFVRVHENAQRTDN